MGQSVVLLLLLPVLVLLLLLLLLGSLDLAGETLSVRLLGQLREGKGCRRGSLRSDSLVEWHARETDWRSLGDDPGVFRAATLGGVDDERSFGECNSGEATG